MARQDDQYCEHCGERKEVARCRFCKLLMCKWRRCADIGPPCYLAEPVPENARRVYNSWWIEGPQAPDVPTGYTPETPYKPREDDLS